MYLSRVKVLAEQPDKLIAILNKDHYQLHQLLWKLFPERTEETKRDFLFRRDDSEGFPLFYLLSVTQPQNLPGVLKVESKEFNPNLNKSDKLSFSLRANPVKKAKLGDDSFARHDVVMHLKKSLSDADKETYSQAEFEQQAGEKWLAQRAEKNGFKVLSVIAQGYQQHHFQKRKIKISTLDFEGLLEVTDVDKFKKVLYQGIGSAKAFGCGLMLIKRA